MTSNSVTSASVPAAAAGSNNLYKVGDFCYFEVSSSGPYQIRRIDELLKSNAGHVEVRATAFCRKRDLPTRLQEKIAVYEKDGRDVPDIFVDAEEDDDHALTALSTKQENGEEVMTEEQKQKHLLSHREVYLTKLTENLPASLIRGKCTVYLWSECEAKSSYLKENDIYFYTHTWDHNSKSLTREKGGDIRVGSGFQADVPSHSNTEGNSESTNGSSDEDKEHSTLKWLPNRATDVEIDNFLMMMRSVGTLGRALDWNSAVKQPSLHLTAASASRDITIASAMDLLHTKDYSLSNCLKDLVAEGPLICRDQMELWTAAEAGLFEEALEKYGKDFEEIKQDLLPWKSMAQVIEYYYMWKTSDRFVQNKRVKAADAEGRLKQIYIPPYIFDDRLPSNEVFDIPARGCESCFTKQSGHWYAWNGFGDLRNNHEGNRLCHECWQYWKKYGDIKRVIKGERKIMLQHGPAIPYSALQKAEIENSKKPSYMLPPNQRPANAQLHQQRQNINMNMGVIHNRSYFRTRPAIYFIATQMMKQVRRVGENIYKPRRSARRPFQWINSAPIKEFYQNADTATVQRCKRPRSRQNIKATSVADRIFARKGVVLSFLDKTNIPQSRLKQSLSSDMPSSAFQQSKRMKVEPFSGSASNLFGNAASSVPSAPRMKIRHPNGRWVWPDAPEDFYYHLSPTLKQERKRFIASNEMKKSGRSQRLVFAVVNNPAKLHAFLASLPVRPAAELPSTLTAPV